MSATKRDRDSSEELGADLAYVKRSKTTGRPARKTAGRKSLPTGYIDSNDIDLEDDHPLDDFYHDEAANADGKHKPWTIHRRRASPPRALPPAAPILDLPTDTYLHSPSTIGSLPSQELSLTFHVEPGHTGPFVVKLDLGSIMNGSPNMQAGLKVPPNPWISELSNCVASGGSGIISRAMTPNKVSFLSLPAELRNYVYRLVFVGPRRAVNLRTADGFCRSSAFLATCRQVHHEGVQILYGENKFVLERQLHVRAAYYESTWTEVGYKDCFRFLSTINAVNISYIRTLTILFEDHSSRFVEDDSLMECLKLLAHYGQLKKLKLAIQGRKMLHNNDHRFLDNLLAIKADIVKLTSRPKGKRYYHGGWYGGRTRVANVSEDLDLRLVEKMQRKSKMWKEPPISTRTRRQTLFPIKLKSLRDVQCAHCYHYWPLSMENACCWIAAEYFRKDIFGPWGHLFHA